ncbi:MAG: glycosyltransferase [Candidatus Aminicenantes bacterium]|nr:glycosyltransferase [Candidatus Aminicenantes bacterium]
MKKYKILRIVTNSTIEPGGAANHVYYLTTKIDPERYLTTVACGGGQDLISKLNRAKIEVKVIPTMIRKPSFGHDFLTVLHLYRIIRNDSFDIIATHGSKAGFLGRVAAFLARAPIIVFTAHGFIFNESINRLRKKLFIWMEWLGSKLAHRIITVSNYDRESAVLNRVSEEDKLKTIYNGIDIDDFNEKEGNYTKKALGLKDNNMVIGSVANFFPNKGLHYLIKGISELAKRHPNLVLFLVGDGPLRNELIAETKELNITDKVFFLGHVNNIPQVLKLFDIFVLPSLKEGFPWAILEAMAAKKAIVATEVGGVPEMIKDGESGVLVKPGDIDSLVKKTRALLIDSRLREKLGEAAQKRVAQKFTLKKMIEETESFYEELIQERITKVLL